MARISPSKKSAAANPPNDSADLMIADGLRSLIDITRDIAADLIRRRLDPDRCVVIRQLPQERLYREIPDKIS